jgi:hypothetical protein
LILFSFATSLSCSLEEKGDDQKKGALKNVVPQRNFPGEWKEESAKIIVMDICQEWNVSEGGFSVKKSIPFRENGISKRVVQVLVQGESCRFCPGTVGAVVFSNKEDTWEVEFGREILNVGSWGVAPAGDLVKIGSKSWGVIFQWPRTAQGGGYVGHVALSAYVDGIFRNVLFVETGYFEDLEEIEQEIKFIPGANPDFFDIVIASKVYRFIEGEYEIQGEP